MRGGVAVAESGERSSSGDTTVRMFAMGRVVVRGEKQRRKRVGDIVVPSP